MTATLLDSTGKPYYLVSVGAGETFPGTTRALPYPTSIGTIDARTGAINVWTPAAPVFRGYRKAAQAWLEAIRATLPIGT